MTPINDLSNLVDRLLTGQCIIQQCIIKDYAIDDMGNAICSVITQKNSNFNTLTELKNVSCFVGSAVNIAFNDYMSGLLIRQMATYQTANNISQGIQNRQLNYLNKSKESLIAIILPNEETISNITEASIKANYCYFGNADTNILDEFSEYVKLMKEFFDKLAQNAPTIAAQPAGGSAALQMAGQEMSQKSDELYQKLTKITKKQ